jgi:hypothetical protein
MAAPTASATPPQIICIADDIKVSRLPDLVSRRARIEPSDHDTGASTINTTWSGRPASDGPPMRTSTPAKPMISDNHSRRLGFSPVSAASTPIHSGVVAHTTAAPPDDTVSSPIATNPLPPTHSSAPIGTAANHCLALGHGAPRRIAIANSTSPAAEYRMLAMRSGGSSVTTMRIAR